MNNFDHSISTVFIHYIALGFIVMPDVEARPTFLEDIIRFYGQNDTFSVESLENILGLMKKGRGTYALKDDQNSLVNSKCLSATEVLSQYDLLNHTELSVEHLQHICPALLHQGVLSACPDSVPHKRVDYKVWGYAFLAVTVINLSSLIGLLLTPFTTKPCFPKLLTYFMGLAIGTLFSNAVLQLIPEALGFDPKADDYILKAIGIFGGFYILFITERMLKLVLKTNHEHGQSHLGPTQQTPATPLPKVDVTARGEVAVVCSAVSIDSLAGSRASIISDAPAQQFPEMNSILKEQEGSTSNALLFFLIQNAGLLSGFSIILLLTMFAGDISLG